jgi:hypothetical protein
MGKELSLEKPKLLSQRPTLDATIASFIYENAYENAVSFHVADTLILHVWLISAMNSVNKIQDANTMYRIYSLRKFRHFNRRGERSGDRPGAGPRPSRLTRQSRRARRMAAAGCAQ